MKVPPKDISQHTFYEGMDSDSAAASIKPKKARYLLNLRSTQRGEKSVNTNVKGNTFISVTLPSGMNKAIGFALDEPQNKFYYFVANSNHYDTIYRYDGLQNIIIPVFQNLTDTNGIDITRFNPDHLITMADVIDHTWLSWVDGLNPARKFNIAKAMDKSSTGYGYTIREDYINAYKKTAVYPPTAVYFTDSARTSNYLYGKLLKFCQWFIYDDGSISNISDYSLVAIPPNESYLGVNSISYLNNCIHVQIETGSPLVIKIGVGVKIGSNDFAQAIILDKVDLKISSDTNYTYAFYNDSNGNYATLNPAKAARPYSFLPSNPRLQAYAQTAMIYGGFFEGFDNVPISIDIAVSYQNIFLPNSTTNAFNKPFFANVGFDYYFKRTLGIGHVNYTVSINRFEVGYDVKKGNVFKLYGNNGEGDVYNFVYIATGVDDANSIANVFKSCLRGIGRGVPDGNNGISGESTDSIGNVNFTYTYLGQYRKNKTRFDGSVTAVNVQSLKDTGTSIKKIKSGSNRKYAFGYPDADGRKTLAYTNNSCLVHTDFVTETGEKKLPVHTLSIKHRPPVWADKWQLLRTFDSGDFIQLLIQQVITVTTTDTGIYYDLVVGSLFTYQAMHPNTVLAYEFDKTDRIRLIKNETTGILYPYFETEVLSYSIDTEQVKNENINTNGTSTVQIDGTASADNVGKTLLVSGFSRTITSFVDGSHYGLDRPLDLSPAGNGNPAKVANYTLVDRRGIIRIRKPSDAQLPGGIANLSTVEITKPLSTVTDTENKIFYDFGMTFDISNPGTATRAHRAPVQSQDGTTDTALISTPAIIKVTEGDTYLRFRELPTNNSIPGTQVVIDSVEDPNYSDFYESNLKDTGRAYPEYNGTGRTYFGSRLRFSNNHIEDTKINGLNDFDNLDRKDYYDPYGDFTLIKYKEGGIYAFKELKTGRINIFARTISTQDQNESLSASDKLLNDIKYYEWQGGIGKNAESWGENGIYQYFASANSGVFLRLSQSGLDPISSENDFDYDARKILAAVAKYNLPIPFGFDRENGEAMWSVASYKHYLFNNPFNDAEWQKFTPLLAGMPTVRITTPPSNGIAIIVANQISYQPNQDFIGKDFFFYQIQLPDGSWTQNIQACGTVADDGKPTTYTATRSQSFTKNDCGANTTPSTVSYSRQYTSIINQADAQSQADNDNTFAGAGQTYANTNGTCTPKMRINTYITEVPEPDYVDVNIDIKDNGVEVARLTTNDSFVNYVTAGSPFALEAFSEAVPIMPKNGYLRFVIYKNDPNKISLPIFSQSTLAYPGLSIIFNGVSASNDVYEVYVDSFIQPNLS